MSESPPAPPPAPDAPWPFLGFAALMRMGMSGTDFFKFGPELEARTKRNPRDANALMDLSTVLLLMMMPENHEIALSLQARAIDMQRRYRLPAAGKPAIRLLAFVGPGDLTTNTHLDCLLENSDVEITLLYLAPWLPPPASLPEHDLVFVALGESPASGPLLKQLEGLAKSSGRPVVNPPERVAMQSRDAVSTRLRSVPGVSVPMTARVDRQSLERISRGEHSLASVLEDGAYPVILRPIGTHGGKDLVKLDAPEAIKDYLKGPRNREFYISRFVGYSGPDGQFRKIRIAMIGGRPFVCHLAISSHWIVHYANAGMLESAEKRSEEERFMANFDADFAHRHRAALDAIDAQMGLDYYGIDCAETPDGRLLVFEVDSAMLVHAVDPVDLFPYKRPQMGRVFGAFRELLAQALKR